MCVLFLLPALLFMCLLFAYPAADAVYISFFDWSGFTASKTFVGLKNFQELFTSSRFWEVPMLNTLKFLLVGGVFVFGFALLFSGILTGRMPGKKLLRAVIFFPNVINPVAVTILWGFIYNQKWGLLNNALTALGLPPQIWTGPQLMFGSILAMMIWVHTGLYCVIFLSALDQVPPEMVESAELDGANGWQVFFHIKLPLIRDVMSTALTLWSISAIKEFSLIFAWGGGIDIPQDQIMNLSNYMYIHAFGKRTSIFRMGLSSAMGVIMLVIVILLTLLIARVTRHESIEM